jgi:hypothetical protein
MGATLGVEKRSNIFQFFLVKNLKLSSVTATGAAWVPRSFQKKP